MSPRSGPGPELRALLLAALLSLCFLGAAVRPDHVLLPYRATCVSPRSNAQAVTLQSLPITSW